MRAASDDGKQETDFLINTILRFLSYQEHQNYNVIENKLLPLLLSRSTDFMRGCEANFLEFGSISLDQARFLTRVFRKVEYLKVYSTLMENVIFLGFVANFKEN